MMKLALPLLLVAAASAMGKLTSFAIALSNVYCYFLLINLITDTKLLIFDGKRYKFCLTCFATASQQPANRWSWGRKPDAGKLVCKMNPGHPACGSGRSDSSEFVGIFDAKRIQLLYSTFY